nr:putative ribonuclease H-like domain-containing protein [Tanacetum cinerariifolium]
IAKIENLKDYKVKIISCDNGGEFRNKEMNDFCSQKRIKREFSNARTPQQNGVAERRNKTLIGLISDLVKYQEHYTKVEDFIPMGSKEETERLKRKGLNLEKEQVKKQKSSEEAPEIKTSNEEFTKEKIKEMMQLVPLKDVYVQALQVKHPIIDWKVHTEGQRSYWQIIRLGGTFACYQFFVDLLKQLDREDLNQLWALVKEYLSIRPASSDKEMELWVELMRIQRDLYASRKSLSTQKRFSTCDDQLQALVKVVPTARRLEMPLPEVCTAIEEKKKKLPVKDRWQLH